MKNVLIISSSPRKGGNSDLLCDQFAIGAQESGNTVEKVSLKDYHINYCSGCGVCYHTKQCPQTDDMPLILEQMERADVIVLASPIYFYTMCAQLKTVIDRCCARYTELNDKEFYYILTAADENNSATDRAVSEFQGFLDCLGNPIHRGTVHGVGAWKVGDIRSKSSMNDSYTLGLNV